MNRNQTLESDAIIYSNKWCHSAYDMENSSSKPQHCNGSNRNIAHTAQQKCITGIYKYILVRCTAAYIIITKINQVRVPCCEATHGA